MKVHCAHGIILIPLDDRIGLSGTFLPVSCGVMECPVARESEIAK